MAKVSVVIPCYNYARYLPEAVESVLNQTYRDFEIVIVNDGSEDDTKEVAEGIIKKYPMQSIRLINQANQGLSEARNAGIRLAAAEYILPLDADDVLEPVYLEETVKVLDENPGVCIAYTDWQMFGDVTDEQKAFSLGREYNLETLLDSNFIHSCNLFRRKAWAEVGGYKKEMSKGFEDWEFWLALAEAGYKGKLVNKRLFLYRQHGPSMIDASEVVREELLSGIRRLHPKLYNWDAMDNIIKRRGDLIRERESYIKTLDSYIKTLDSYIKTLVKENIALYEELKYMRTGKGSLKNVCRKLFRRIFGGVNV